MSLDDTSGREIGTFDILHQLLDCNLRIVDVGTYRITALRQVVRSHVRRHSDRNTRCSVQKQKRNLCRKDCRFLKGVVEIVLKIDCIFVKVCKDLI